MSKIAKAFFIGRNLTISCFMAKVLKVSSPFPLPSWGFPNADTQSIYRCMKVAKLIAAYIKAFKPTHYFIKSLSISEA